MTDPSTSPPTPLTSHQLLSHPALPTNNWSSLLPPTSSGHIPTNTSSLRRGPPIPISYSLHGHGPRHILWIMGLGAYKSAWKRQVKYFCYDEGRGEKYTSLVFDNRGVGESGKPVGRWSTREMAGDVVEVLGGVGWLESKEVERVLRGFYDKRGKVEEDRSPRRDIVVVGVSMGGMIAQELALLIPERIQALVLVSTASRLIRTVPFLENLRQRINMFIPRSVDVQLDEVAHRLFSDEFLARRDTENDDPRLNFPTNQDRFAAGELEKRMDKEGFTRLGFICQAIAAGWHHKGPEQLREMVRRVGGQRICVMHGTGDQMLTFKHFEVMKEEIGEESGVEWRVWEEVGHVLGWEREKEFNGAVEEFIEKVQGLQEE